MNNKLPPMFQNLDPNLIKESEEIVPSSIIPMQRPVETTEVAPIVEKEKTPADMYEQDFNQTSPLFQKKQFGDLLGDFPSIKQDNSNIEALLSRYNQLTSDTDKKGLQNAYAADSASIGLGALNDTLSRYNQLQAGRFLNTPIQVQDINNEAKARAVAVAPKLEQKDNEELKLLTEKIAKAGKGGADIKDMIRWKDLQLRQQANQSIDDRQKEGLFERGGKAIESVASKYDKETQKMRDAGFSSDKIEAIINESLKGNANTIGPLGVTAAKAYGEVGSLTESDVNRYIERAGIANMAVDKAYKFFKGELSPQSAEDISAMTKLIKEAVTDRENRMKTKYFHRAYKNYGGSYGIPPQEVADKMGFGDINDFYTDTEVRNVKKSKDAITREGKVKSTIEDKIKNMTPEEKEKRKQELKAKQAASRK